MKHTGIRLVAKTAGVSIGTVSKVLNPGSGGNIRVSPETTAKVLAAAKKVNYSPSYSAKLLRGESTHTVGFVALMPSDRDGVYLSGYAARILNGVGRVAKENDYQVLIVSGADYASLMEVKRVDALVLVGFKLANNPEDRSMQTMFKNFNKRGCAYVVVNGTGGRVPVPAISVDNSDGMRQIAELLIRKKYASAGFIGELAENPLAHHCERLAALKKYLQGTSVTLARKHIFNGGGVGLPPRPRNGRYSYDDGAAAVEYMVSCGSLPRCLVCGNDQIAVSAMQKAHALNIKIPEELAIIGFDNDANVENLTPALTTVEQPLEDFGAEAMTFLLAKMRDPSLSIERIIPPRLLVRGTA